jgi:Ca2+-binding RTX toxin-like protein
VNGELKRRVGLLAAGGAALAAGALLAVAVSSAAGPQAKVITLADGPERLLTIRGSDGVDTVGVFGSAPGGVTLQASLQFTNQRTDCTIAGPVSTTAFCGDDDQRTIDIGLIQGRDRLIFGETFDQNPPGVKIIGRGGKGADRLGGSRFADRHDGGAGDDRLNGKQGNDKLDGGPGEDDCTGGPGQDELKRCE